MSRALYPISSLSRLRLFGAFVFAVQQFTASVASAQAGGKQDCLNSLPPSVFTALPVLLDARASDPAAIAILPAADILTQLLAEQVRSIVGTSNEKLPAADSLLTWRQINGEIAVTVNRDGRFTWAKRYAVDETDTAEYKGLDLLDRSLRKVADSGERLFWPESARGNSLSFTVSLVQPSMRQDGKVEPATVRAVVPVFTLMRPWEKALVVVRPPVIYYAQSSVPEARDGRLILEFVVDTTGRIDMETVREHWPTGGPHAEFLSRSKGGLREARFQPAVVGGCLVRRRAQQVYPFKLDP